MEGYIPLHTPVFLYNSGVQGGIHYTDMFPYEKHTVIREFLPT